MNETLATNRQARAQLLTLATNMGADADAFARAAVGLCMIDSEMPAADNDALMSEVYAACSALCACASKLREIAARLPE